MPGGLVYSQAAFFFETCARTALHLLFQPFSLPLCFSDFVPFFAMSTVLLRFSCSTPALPGNVGEPYQGNAE